MKQQTTRHRWAERFPQLGTGPISTEPYISQEIFEREREHVFRKTWLNVGRVEEVPRAGDYKAKRIDVLNASAVIVRGKDGVIRAFHNQCSHRANKVVEETGENTYGSNRGAVLTCRFHGWVYNDRGSLVEVPEQERFFPCFDAKSNGLAPIHCDVWAGFIFVNFDERPEKSLREYLGAYGDHFGTFPYEQMPYCLTYQTHLNANWKVALDAFAEAYHVPTIHSGTFPLARIDVDDVQLFGDHRTCGIFTRLDSPPTPTAQLANRLARASLAEHVSDSSRLPPNINPQRRSDFIFELSVLFPNFLLHVTDGIWFTHQFWPVSVDRTFWEGKYYLRTPRSHSERWAVEYSQILQRNAWLEDTATMEATQEAARSRAKRKMFLQDDEVLLRHGYRVLERYLGMALEAQ